VEAGGLGMGCGDQQYRAKPATDRSGLLVLRELLDAALASDVLASSVPARHARNNVAMPARSVLVALLLQGEVDRHNGQQQNGQVPSPQLKGESSYRRALVPLAESRELYSVGVVR
jgi:hypothetical protein